MLKFKQFNFTSILNHNFGIISNVNLVRPTLGRWLVEKDVKKIHIKIDQANEDHCGCCNITLQDDEDNEYYKPFFY
jgi:hypothetical protein